MALPASLPSDASMDRIKQQFLLFLKGVAMGAADVVPGVSGGTIAFISGIYEELLDSIRSINLHALTILKNQGVAAFWRAINGNFLSVLFSGILLSIASLARVVSYSLEYYPILVWSFFFGLIVASIIYIFRQLSHLRWKEWLGLWLGTLVALGISFAPRIQGSDDLFVVFCAGAVAICAMILPGISGSFILLLLGMYPVMISAISDFQWQILLVFILGCGCGLMAFSRVLSWLLHHYYSVTISVLTGFLLGSLLIVWPWKESLEVMVDHKGRDIMLSHQLLMPTTYGEVTGIDPNTIAAVGCMLSGLILVLALEYVGGQRKKL
jgi:putative membrane protein